MWMPLVGGHQHSGTMKKRYVLAIVFAAISIILFWLIAEKMNILKEQMPTSWTEDHSADCAVVLTGQSGHWYRGHWDRGHWDRAAT